MTERPDILSMIDHAVQDWETSPDAMRWTPEPPKEPERVDLAELHRARLAALPLQPRERVHPRVVDEHRDGSRLVPFVGGPRHGSLLRLPMDPGYAWNVLEPQEWTVDPTEERGPDYVTYCVRRSHLNLPVMEMLGLYERWSGMVLVCAYGSPSEDDLRWVAERALGDGWQPWRYPQPVVA